MNHRNHYGLSQSKIEEARRNAFKTITPSLLMLLSLVSGTVLAIIIAFIIY